MSDSPRQSAALHETAKVLRAGGCPTAVLRALRACPLTVAELSRVLRGRYAARTLYGALQTLRQVGLAEGSGVKEQHMGSGLEEVWRAV
jgi:hypothetical protein